MKMCLRCKINPRLSNHYRTKYCSICKRIVHKEYITNYTKSWQKRMRKINPEKLKRLEMVKRQSTKKERSAINKVNQAIISKKLFRPINCECCGEIRDVEGHHPNYDKPLEVRWLCGKCHTFLHRYLKSKAEELIIRKE